MKVFIRDVENGWLVHYDVMSDRDDNYRKVDEKEKVFTYDFEDEKENTWRRLEWFIAKKLIDWKLHQRIYLQTYDEKKGKWVGNQEFQKGDEEEENYFDENRWKNREWRERGSGKITRWSRQDVKIFKKWEEERIADMTLEARELRCANLTFDNLLAHFNSTKPNHTCMTLEEYEEIRSASEEQCTKVFGSKP